MNDAVHAYTAGTRVRRWLAGSRRPLGRWPGRGLGPELRRGLGWAALAGIALGSLLAPINAKLQGLEMSDILSNAVDGLVCMFLGQGVGGRRK